MLSKPLTVLPLALLTLAAPAGAAAAPPQFGARELISVGPGAAAPHGLVAARLDGDGALDLVAADRTTASAGHVTVLLGNGHGAFAPASGSPFAVLTAGALGPLALADADGDGKLDVLAGVATGTAADAIATLRNTGGGVLAEQPTPVATRAGLTGLAAGDLDGDGVPEIVTSHDAALLTDQLGVLRRTSGLYTLQGSYGAGRSSRAFALAVGNLDGAGPDDVLVASAGGAWVAHGGTGALSTSAPVPAGTDPAAVTLADVDGDGDIDAVVVDGTAPLLTVLRNDGHGTLSPTPISVPALQAGSGITAGDLDGDGRPDLAIADAAGDELGILMNDGTGAFTLVSWLAMGAAPRSPVIADLDGDGVADLAAAATDDDAIVVRRGLGEPAPSTGPPAAETTTPPTTVTAPSAAPVPVPTIARPPRRRAGLVLTLARTRATVDRGRRVAVDYALGRAATVVARVKRGGRTVRVMRRRGTEGRNRLVWDGRLGRRAAPRGTYRLTLHAVAADGAAARATITVRVR